MLFFCLSLLTEMSSSTT